jgi:phosphoglucosamine mutase
MGTMVAQTKKNRKNILFGTDGIRGAANQYPMTAEIALNTGRAAVVFCKKRSNGKKPRIIIGRDTRVSGEMIECALISGICSMGGDVLTAGVLPTPGVAYLTRHLNADAGIVVSASHNPYFDNGIKFFNQSGFKLSDQEEAHIETLILDKNTSILSSDISDTGRVYPIWEAQKAYADFIKNSINQTTHPFDGYKIAIDCSNGATSDIAPGLFSDLGAQTSPIEASPDGYNINHHCGSQHPERLSEKVIETGADIGVAFDGDGDRLIAVDETGTILSGDQILAVFANYLHKNETLKNKTVVSTIMSNIGLARSLARMGITHIKSDVGDRYVMEQMKISGASLGGEDSGHIIFLDHHTTGDGMLAAVQLLNVMQAEAKSLSKLAGLMTVFPQTLMNVSIKDKQNFDEIPEIKQAIESAENSLAGKGRILVRYSGTQPVCRVMVEALEMDEANRHCKRIVDIIKQVLG